MSAIHYVNDDGVHQGGWDGSDPPSGLHAVPTAPDDNRQIWDFDNEVWLPVEAVALPKIPTAIASAKLTISDGVVGGFAADSAIAGGFAMDVGKFWMFFGTPQPDIDYIVSVFDGGLYRCYVQPDDYLTDSFFVTTTDLAGTPADPACISIIIMRAI
jgi:hypothetical protein